MIRILLDFQLVASTVSSVELSGAQKQYENMTERCRDEVRGSKRITSQDERAGSTGVKPLGGGATPEEPESMKYTVCP